MREERKHLPFNIKKQGTCFKRALSGLALNVPKISRKPFIGWHWLAFQLDRPLWKNNYFQNVTIYSGSILIKLY